MNFDLRLLFLGTLLFCLLGLFSGKSEGTEQLDREPVQMELMELPTGLLPFLPNTSFNPLEEKNALDRNSEVLGCLEYMEVEFTGKAQVKMQLQDEDYLHRKPDKFFRIGLYLHYTPREVPPALT